MVEITIPLMLLIGYLIFVSKGSIINFGEINIYSSDCEKYKLEEKPSRKKLQKKLNASKGTKGDYD